MYRTLETQFHPLNAFNPRFHASRAQGLKWIAARAEAKGKPALAEQALIEAAFHERALNWLGAA